MVEKHEHEAKRKHGARGKGRMQEEVGVSKDIIQEAAQNNF